MILEFADALINEARAVAVLSAWSKLQLPYEDLSKAGFQLTLNPFFRSLLLAVYRNAVAGLRYKTCIALPVDRARNMLGVVDTTNKLRYGEAFVQSTEMRSPHVQHKGPPKKTVITSTVLVTKCPFLHPGDVRKIPAVDVPELHHVIECIVVPAHGPRPHPDKWPVSLRFMTANFNLAISRFHSIILIKPEETGSDLDGDEYVVIWEKRLFFPGPNRMPINFSDRNPEPHGKQITVLINEKNRHVEIYLDLKTPSMLMGEVIMDSQSRPGSAAAATLLRWERHLATGCDCIGDTVRMASLCGGLFLKLVLTDHSLERRVHFKNMILREFNAEFAIRLSFRDDNLEKLSFPLNLHSSLDAILNAAVARFLHDGLQVGTRELKFLAPSTSQLCDHGSQLVF
ncbi:hypothetical protein MRX96_021198 [Rhipicephalus microplus]